MSEQPEQLRNLSPEARARRASGNTTAKARAGRAASPWNRGPMCATANAKSAFQRYQEAGKR